MAGRDASADSERAAACGTWLATVGIWRGESGAEWPIGNAYQGLSSIWKGADRWTVCEMGKGGCSRARVERTKKARHWPPVVCYRLTVNR